MNQFARTLTNVKDIHHDIITVIGWMNKDVPEWLKLTDRFYEVYNEICKNHGMGTIKLNVFSVDYIISKK